MCGIKSPWNLVFLGSIILYDSCFVSIVIYEGTNYASELALTSLAKVNNIVFHTKLEESVE